MPTTATPYVVAVKNATLAVSLDDLNIDKAANLSSLLQPVFFTATRDFEGNWTNKKFFRAIPCEDVFGDAIEETESLNSTLTVYGPWYCPANMTTYQILNQGNEALYLHLESCQKAAEHLNITDDNCVTDTTFIDEYLNGKIGIRTKYIT